MTEISLWSIDYEILKLFVEWQWRIVDTNVYRINLDRTSIAFSIVKYIISVANYIIPVLILHY